MPSHRVHITLPDHAYQKALLFAEARQLNFSAFCRQLIIDAIENDAFPTPSDAISPGPGDTGNRT